MDVRVLRAFAWSSPGVHTVTAGEVRNDVLVVAALRMSSIKIDVAFRSETKHTVESAWRLKLSHLNLQDTDLRLGRLDMSAPPTTATPLGVLTVLSSSLQLWKFCLL